MVIEVPVFISHLLCLRSSLLAQGEHSDTDGNMQQVKLLPCIKILSKNFIESSLLSFEIMYMCKTFLICFQCLQDLHTVYQT